MNNTNYYNLLGVSPTATSAEITQAFRKRILQVHLDKLPQGQDTSVCYDTIEAHRILSNKDSRVKYDIQRDTELNRVLSEAQLREKYSNCSELPVDELRAKHNADRKKERSEKFIPAGAICYQVDQLSKVISDQISKWENEYDDNLQDNYFESFSNLFSQVLEEPNLTPTRHENWTCALCDKNFLDSHHHFNQVLLPYVDYLSWEQVGLQPLYEFFQSNVSLFSWEPRYLPSQPQGIWGCAELWRNLPKIQQNVAQLLDKIPPAEDFVDLQDHVDFVQKNCTQNSASQVPYILTNQSNLPELCEKANELLCADEIEDLIKFACVMHRLIGFRDWKDLVKQALELHQLELSMFWTMFGKLVGDENVPSWFDLGMTIVSEGDLVLAHFCFLLGGYNMNMIADIFASNGRHFAAAEWIINSGHLNRLLEMASQPEGDLYKTLYYSARIKFLLKRLSTEVSSTAEDLEELIEMILIICPTNYLQAFKIIVNTYPNAFGSVECFQIHRTMIQFLQQQALDFNSLNLILAATHFLPAIEFDQDFFSWASLRLTRKELEVSVKSINFESLTSTLLNLNRRNKGAAESLLDNLSGQEDGNHLRAMRLLIEGTIHRVNSDWLNSMSAYQNALLNTPECLYRLVPCVSKLTQDELFHECVLNQVQSEVRQLKEFCDFEEYLEIDTNCSLVVADPIPKEYYQDMTSKIQQVDPEEFKPKAQDEPTPIETNTPLVTITKNERAIETGQDKLEALNAAFAYVDLIRALPIEFQNGPIVMAASHLLRAMNSTEEPSSLFAYRNAIYMMAENLYKLHTNTQANVQSCLSHKHMFSIILMANQKLSQALQIQTVQQIKPQTQLISTSDYDLISKFLSSVVNFPKIEPLVNIPTLNCSDLQYVETIWNKFMLQFCRDKVSTSTSCAAGGTAAIQAYTLFVEVAHGRSDLMDFDTAKEKAMQLLLMSKGWTVKDVENLLEWPLAQFTDDGWTNTQSNYLKLSGKSYKSIDGFQIDEATGEILFFLSTSPESTANLFTSQDIVEIFQNQMDRICLDFEKPDLNLVSHPFHGVRYEPADFASTEYSRSILRVAMLLHYFAAGIELNTKSPFYTRNVQLGLMNRLPEHLQYFCRSITARGKSGKNTSQTLCVNTADAYFEECQENSIFTYKIGNIQMEIKPSAPNQSGVAVEQFANDFTRNYDEIGMYFSELLRIKELFKISLIFKKLKDLLLENKVQIEQNGKSEMEICRLEQFCSAIENLGISTEDQKNAVPISTCNWIPSSSCNPNAELVTSPGRVCMNIEPIFGPVNLPANFELIPVKTLFTDSSSDLIPKNVETTVYAEFSNQKSFQYSNVIKEAMTATTASTTAGVDKYWWTKTKASPDSTAELYDAKWCYVKSSDELYHNDVLIFKRNQDKDLKDEECGSIDINYLDGNSERNPSNSEDETDEITSDDSSGIQDENAESSDNQSATKSGQSDQQEKEDTSGADEAPEVTNQALQKINQSPNELDHLTIYFNSENYKQTLVNVTEISSDSSPDFSEKKFDNNLCLHGEDLPLCSQKKIEESTDGEKANSKSIDDYMESDEEDNQLNLQDQNPNCKEVVLHEDDDLTDVTTDEFEDDIEPFSLTKKLNNICQIEFTEQFGKAYFVENNFNSGSQFNVVKITGPAILKCYFDEDKCGLEIGDGGKSGDQHNVSSNIFNANVLRTMKNDDQRRFIEEFSQQYFTNGFTVAEAQHPILKFKECHISQSSLEEYSDETDDDLNLSEEIIIEASGRAPEIDHLMDFDSSEDEWDEDDSVFTSSKDSSDSESVGPNESDNDSSCCDDENDNVILSPENVNSGTEIIDLNYYKLCFSDGSTRSKSSNSESSIILATEDSESSESHESSKEADGLEEDCYTNVSAEVGPATNQEKDSGIPVGVYSISKAYTDPNRGPLTMQLTLINPIAETNSTFYIHGTNKNYAEKPRQNNELEPAVLIMPSNIRKQISSSGDKTLLVE